MAGFKSRINKVLLILQCRSEQPEAKIWKWSHLMRWPVELMWLAIAENWPLLLLLVNALKCSIFLSCSLKIKIKLKLELKKPYWSEI